MYQFIGGARQEVDRQLKITSSLDWIRDVSSEREACLRIRNPRQARGLRIVEADHSPAQYISCLVQSRCQGCSWRRWCAPRCSSTGKDQRPCTVHVGHSRRCSTAAANAACERAQSAGDNRSFHNHLQTTPVRPDSMFSFRRFFQRNPVLVTFAIAILQGTGVNSILCISSPFIRLYCPHVEPAALADL